MSGVDMDSLIAVTRETWEHVVEQRGRKADWVPKVMVMDDSGCAVAGGVVGMEQATDLVAAVEQIVDAATAWVAVTVDSFLSTDPTVLASERPLSDWYAAGHPAVLDCLTILMVERGGRSMLTELPYRVRGRHVHWLGEHRLDTTSGGDHIGGDLAVALIAVMTRGAN